MNKFTMPPQAERKEFKTCPEGMHVARCVSFVDIGTHEFEWQGELKTPRKVRISFETPNETTVFNEEAGEQPFLVSTELTLSFHEKSNLSKILSGWIGFKEGKDFDPEKDVLGVPCMINVSHQESKKGNKFAKIVGVTPLMKGADCPDQINETTYFFMGYNGHASEFDDKAFAGLPEFLQNKIKESPEYEDAKGGKVAVETGADIAKSIFKEKEEIKPDDLPF